MTEGSIWDIKLRLVLDQYHARREQFIYSTETYNSWVWLALEKGSFWFRIGSGRGALEGQCNAGDWVLCPPHLPFQRRMLETSSFYYARFEISGGLGSEVLHPLRGKGTLRDSARLRANFAALRATEYTSDTQQWKAHVLLDILRCAWWESQNTVKINGGDREMQKVQHFLAENFSSKISLETLAREVHLSPTTFSKRFRAATGTAPQEFLLQKRLDCARRLLLETDLTLDAVASRCGFATGFYFSRLWTKRFGIAPAQFRRLHQI